MSPEQILADERRHAAVRRAVRKHAGTILSDALTPPPPQATRFVREPSHFSSREESCERMTRTRRRRRREARVSTDRWATIRLER